MDEPEIYSEVRESEIEAKGRALVTNKYDGVLLKFRLIGRRGGSDNLLVLPYAPVVFVEFKTFDGRQSAGQLRFEHEMVGRGQRYWIVRSVESFDLRIREYLNYCDGGGERWKEDRWTNYDPDREKRGLGSRRGPKRSCPPPSAGERRS